MASVVLVLLTLLAAGDTPPSQQVSGTDSATDESIVITGTRIQAADRKSASPIQSIRAEDFALTGVPNVEQTLNQLPQLVPSYTNTSNNPGTGAATLDLRGLGSVRTLILVNGRRWIANDAGQIPEVDVNTIPSALIDRVDIVTGGASAVYGSDAVTGVINFVLKKKLEGVYLEARNNISERGDGRSSSADLSWGTSFLGGRGNLILSAGWLDQASLTQGSRGFSRYALSDACILKGSADSYGAGIFAGNDECLGDDEEWGFVRSGSESIPQGHIQAPAYIPTGVGDELTRVQSAKFVPGGSITGFTPQIHSFNYAPENYLQVPLRRISSNLLGSLELSRALEAYWELSFVRTRSPQQFASTPGDIGTGSDSVAVAQINLDNPFLSPQGRQVLDISYGVDSTGQRGFVGNSTTGFVINPAYTGDADGIVDLPSFFSTRLLALGPRRAENERRAYRGLVGSRGEIAANWTYDAYFSYSNVTHDIDYLNSASASALQQAMLVRDDGTGHLACIDPSNGCVPIDVYGQQVISPEAADFLRINPVERTRVKESVAELSVKTSQPFLPAGDLDAVFAASWRRTSYQFAPDRSFEQGDILGYFATTAASGKTSVFELFGETLVPLLSSVKFAQELSAELGLRYSSYSSVGGEFTWKAMANWSPFHGMRLRAGMQRAVRAPNARELFEESAVNFTGAFDPCAPFDGFQQTAEVVAACANNGAADLPADPYFILAHTSGSTKLNAETAHTLTIGAVLQLLHGVEATLDYYDIRIDDAIGIFGGGPGYVAVGCIFGGGKPSDPLCQAYTRGADGFIADMYIPTANLARLSARGIDWQIHVRQSVARGRLDVALSGTRLFSSEVQYNDNVGKIDCAGFYGFPCGNTVFNTATPKWKLLNQASWSRDGLTLSLRHRWFSSTRSGIITLLEALNQPPLEPGSSPDFRKMQARHYFDASIAMRIADRFELTVGVNNLTDARPSLVGNQQVQSNTDPSLYDVLGRRYFVTLAVRLQ